MKRLKVNKLLYYSFLLTSLYAYSMDSSARDTVQYQADGLSTLIVATKAGNINVQSWDKDYIQLETCKHPLQEKYHSHLNSTEKRIGNELSIEGSIEPYTEVISQPSTTAQPGLGSFHEDKFGNLNICGVSSPAGKKLVFKGGGKCKITTAFQQTISNGEETTTYGPGTTISYSGGNTTRTSLSTKSIEKTITDLGRINYEITLPHLAVLALMLKTKNGSIITEHVSGPQKLDATEAIRVTGALQTVKAQGKNLDIHQADDAQGKISATAEGSTIIRNFAQKLKVETPEGNVVRFYRNPRNTTGKAKIYIGSNFITEGSF